MDILQLLPIDELLSSPAGQRIAQAMDTIAAVQHNLVALASSEDSTQLSLLKVGTVFQVFLMDLLASGKNPKEIKPEEWGDIAGKVSKYAILEDGQSYSEFVFSLYADYIDLSAKSISKVISKESLASIKCISAEIRGKSALLRKGKITETTYVEECLWLSLEGMIKLLSSSLTTLIGSDYSKLAQAVSQLGFEYGRCVLYAKEQAILSAYIENQYALDEQLQSRFETFQMEVLKRSERFQRLIEDAFSPNVQDSLLRSIALARAAGATEEELLTTLDDIDRFFME